MLQGFTLLLSFSVAVGAGIADNVRVGARGARTAHKQRGRDMETCKWSEAYDKGFSELLVDDHHGIYVPQVFAKSYVVRESDLDEDMAICASGPDEEFYWESWLNIIDGGTIDGASGHVWSLLLEDGAVFAVRADVDIDFDA